MDAQHFTIAAADNDVATLRAALADGTAVDVRERKNNWTALHWAVYNYGLESIDLLLAVGADPNAQGKIGDTPLHLAVPRAKGRVDAIRRLLAAGADPGIKNNYGISAIQHANTIVGFPMEAFDGTAPLA